ncbi:MAG: response regulator, partial [Sulfurimonas sp.]|nr:response regulator [Sulfurimonas sp.]
YNNNIFYKAREELVTLENSNISISIKRWIQISTQRINDIHNIENKLFDKISKSFNDDIKTTSDALIFQIILILITIFILFLATYIIAKNVKTSIKKLSNGMDDFFKFLHSNDVKPKQIDTNSNDEINEMAQNINAQMKIIEDNLEDDIDFINEATQIVMMMKDGDFSERPYFEPHNQHLIELKAVLNELIELIADKIKEQTDSLEELNRSLEDRVYNQTIELERQIKEITISRDKAIQAEIAKDEFLANMSHEIRTPLNAILGFVTILKKQITDEKPLKYLNIIDTSGKSLLTIINDILDFSKIQSGKFIISPYEINPVVELSNAALLFASKAYEKHILYAAYIDPNLPQTISIDAVRVKQIFSNILSNAIKFTPEDGEIKVKVTSQGNKLKISIQDNGIGIAEKNIDKIFSAFEQADGSTTRKYGGTGLGLSISNKLANLMNGNLSVISKEGKGSTFTLEIPITLINNKPKILIDKNKFKEYTFAILSENKSSKKLALIKKYLSDFGAENIIELSEFQEDGYDLLFFVPSDTYNEDIVYSKKPAIALLRSSSIKLANLEHIQALYAPYIPSAIIQTINDSGIDKIVEHKKTIIENEKEIQFIGSILVAEDNKTNQMLISLILDDYGLEFKMANNGLEAVEMFKKEKFDLVLMDENMPELNGIGAMQQIKKYEQNKKLTFTPIIALTASVLDTDKEMFLNAGMDGFVGKPIDTDELESELDRFLKKK